MPKGHPLARRREPALADLARYPVVSYSPRSRGQIVAKTCRDHGIYARCVVSASDAPPERAMNASHAGVAQGAA